MINWKLPYRLIVVERRTTDQNKSLEDMTANNGFCVVRSVKSNSDALARVMNCGAMMAIIDEPGAIPDISVEYFCRARFFLCEMRPVPFTTIRSESIEDSELADPISGFGLVEALKPTGLLPMVRNAMTAMRKFVDDEQSVWNVYGKVQAACFLKNEPFEIGRLLTAKIPKEDLLHLQIGAATMKKQYNDAAELLIAALLDYPDNDFFHFSNARVMYQLKRTDRARAALDNALEEVNQFSFYLAFRTAIEAGDVNFATAVLKDMAENYSDGYLFQCCRGVWYAQMQRYKEAANEFFWCLSQCEDDLYVSAQLIECLEKLGFHRVRCAIQSMGTNAFLNSSYTQHMYPQVVRKDLLAVT